MFNTFKEACMVRGLLEDDHEWRICLEKAIAMQPRMACHQLLAVILLTDEVAEPHLLWDQFKAGLCDDVKHKLHLSQTSFSHISIKSSTIPTVSKPA